MPDERVPNLVDERAKRAMPTGGERGPILGHMESDQVAKELAAVHAKLDLILALLGGSSERKPGPTPGGKRGLPRYQARYWLTVELRAGPLTWAQVVERARSTKHSERTLRRIRTDVAYMERRGLEAPVWKLKRELQDG